MMENTVYRILANDTAIAAGQLGRLAIRLAFATIIADEQKELTDTQKRRLREIAERIRDVSATLYGICYDMHTV